MANAQKQLKEKTCPVCGKQFIYRDHWAYKTMYGDHVKAYCSWTCFRRMEAEEQKKKRRKAVRIQTI